MLRVQQGLDDKHGRRSHDLHDLIEAEAVELQAKVCEADKAHGAGGEFGDVAQGELLDFEAAELGEEHEQEEGAGEMEPGEGDGEAEVVLVLVHDELVEDDEQRGRGEVEQHARRGGEVDADELRTEAVVHGGVLGVQTVALIGQALIGHGKEARLRRANLCQGTEIWVLRLGVCTGMKREGVPEKTISIKQVVIISNFVLLFFDMKVYSFISIKFRQFNLKRQ